MWPCSTGSPPEAGAPYAPFDAVLCDLDNVIRFYDLAGLAELERAAGLAAGTTTEVAYAPEVDLPLLLGRITPDEWVEAIARGLMDLPAGRRAHGRGTDHPVTDEPVTDHPVTDEPTAGAGGAGAGSRRPDAWARELGRALARAPFRADPAVVSLLRRARARVPLVLVTNASLQLDDDLASLGLTDLAHEIVSSAAEGVAKPDRAIYEIAAARAGVPMERCLFVDDRRENIAAAVALGMTGVLFREPADLERALGPVLDDAPQDAASDGTAEEGTWAAR
ncbi:HAD-IA family hydrolase [Streptomyces sp. NBC_00654]|uniref:HAD family hydrolase n=1 Tax=Streptomyces sp. NBC_00654 TaxID=2975799 RepID=UPI0022516F40|nr:HAD-IA family hydrolase [Streptomyces sp. NBC_00654]MCX4970289.1 HAD-IA family hydrolase [Streptomyces sp. NBC_00654]